MGAQRTWTSNQPGTSAVMPDVHELDEDTSKHVLQLDNYGEDKEWVLLEAA